MCDVHADAGVAGTRTSGYEANARISSQFSVSFGHICGACFVTACHEWDALCIINSVEHLKVTLTGDAKCHVNTVRFQCVDEDSSAGSGV
jgi:hypothetical protein